MDDGAVELTRHSGNVPRLRNRRRVDLADEHVSRVGDVGGGQHDVGVRDGGRRCRVRQALVVDERGNFADRICGRIEPVVGRGTERLQEGAGAVLHAAFLQPDGRVLERRIDRADALPAVGGDPLGAVLAADILCNGRLERLGGHREHLGDTLRRVFRLFPDGLAAGHEAERQGGGEAE